MHARFGASGTQKLGCVRSVCLIKKKKHSTMSDSVRWRYNCLAHHSHPSTMPACVRWRNCLAHQSHCPFNLIVPSINDARALLCTRLVVYQIQHCSTHT